MHPKRIFALFYAAGLIALLWIGVQKSPDLFWTWWESKPTMTHAEKCQEIYLEFRDTYVRGSKRATEEDWAAYKAKLEAVPADKEEPDSHGVLIIIIGVVVLVVMGTGLFVWKFMSK